MIVGDELVLYYCEVPSGAVDTSENYVFYVNVGTAYTYTPSVFQREFEARKNDFSFELKGPDGTISLEKEPQTRGIGRNR